jgi:hypothetical protein
MNFHTVVNVVYFTLLWTVEAQIIYKDCVASREMRSVDWTCKVGPDVNDKRIIAGSLPNLHLFFLRLPPSKSPRQEPTENTDK